MALYLPRGRYYMALVLDNTAATILKSQPTLVVVKSMGVAQEASAFPLPSTATPAVLASSQVPWCGIAFRSTI
jgi:hypothetical protein